MSRHGLSSLQEHHGSNEQKAGLFMAPATGNSESNSKTGIYIVVSTCRQPTSILYPVGLDLKSFRFTVFACVLVVVVCRFGSVHV